MTRTHISRTAEMLFVGVVVFALAAMHGCGGSGGPIAPRFAIAASFYTDSWYPAQPRTDVHDGVTGPPGTWEFDIIRATAGEVRAAGGTDAPGQCTVYDKAGHEVLPGGKNTWTLVEGDYHIVARNEIGQLLAEKWVFADPHFGRG